MKGNISWRWFCWKWEKLLKDLGEKRQEASTTKAYYLLSMGIIRKNILAGSKFFQLSLEKKLDTLRYSIKRQ